MANPFRRILEFSTGDVAAKIIAFLAFVYLAHALGVVELGVLQLANSLFLYVLLVADAGLERWGVREIARTGSANVIELAGRVTGLRVLLAGAAFVVLAAVLAVMPDQRLLRQALLLFSLSVFPQAANLKWVFMGRQAMTVVARGLVLVQMLSLAAVIALVHDPSGLLWVPIIRLAEEIVAAAFFARQFVKAHGRLPSFLPAGGAPRILRPALVLGASAMLGMAAYNFDTVLLGFLIGEQAVGWYSAAYRPVTAALALPVTYFVGVYSALASTHAEDQQAFDTLVRQSLRLMATLAVPLGIAGAALAQPIVLLLFGSAYLPSVPILRLLAVSGVLVTVRAMIQHVLMAAGRAGVELQCAALGVGTNVLLNIALIPKFGMIGAAWATVAAEVLWVAVVTNRLNHYVLRINLLSSFGGTVAAGAAMAASLWAGASIPWIPRALIAAVVYLAVLVIPATVGRWRQAGRPPHAV